MANSDLTIDGDVVRKRYVRTDRGQPEREWNTLVWLHERATDLVPRPLAREHTPPALVMSRLEGKPLDSLLTAAQTTAMIAAYRELFAASPPPEMPARFLPPDEFIATTFAWLNEVTPRRLSKVLRRALAAANAWHVDIPIGLRDIRDPVVVQGDANIANMLWDGRRVRLVDFEYAGRGDLAFEVADLVEHASSRLRGLFDPERVIAGFDLTPEQRDRVDEYRKVLATFWLLMLVPGSPGHRINPAGSAERQAHHLLEML